jgi:hypothetical protein
MPLTMTLALALGVASGLPKPTAIAIKPIISEVRVTPGRGGLALPYTSGLRGPARAALLTSLVRARPEGCGS